MYSSALLTTLLITSVSAALPGRLEARAVLEGRQHSSSDCINAYGTGYALCGTSNCYYRTGGESCCSDGGVCGPGTYCGPGGTCCGNDLSKSQCANAIITGTYSGVNPTGTLGSSALDSATSSFASDVSTTAVDAFTASTTFDISSVTASIRTPTAVATSASTEDSSSNSATSVAGAAAGTGASTSTSSVGASPAATTTAASGPPKLSTSGVGELRVTLAGLALVGAGLVALVML